MFSFDSYQWMANVCDEVELRTKSSIYVNSNSSRIDRICMQLFKKCTEVECTNVFWGERKITITWNDLLKLVLCATEEFRWK